MTLNLADFMATVEKYNGEIAAEDQKAKDIDTSIPLADMIHSIERCPDLLEQMLEKNSKIEQLAEVVHQQKGIMRRRIL